MAIKIKMPPKLQKLSDKVDMVFASFRRYFSMKQQSSKVQLLYDHCNKIFTPSGTPRPSSQALQKLSSVLDTVQPADVGLKEETSDDDRGHGFFGITQLNRVARWAQPITYVDIHEGDSFTMCIFCFPTSSVIPLHDHPGMTVFSKLLYGSLHVKAYDWVEPPCIVENKEPGSAPVRLAKLAVDKVLTAPCETSVLYPKEGGNLHCFTAVTPCAVLDILAPPYSEDAGRKCTYYHDYPYSAFATGNGSKVCDGKEEEYAWLAEIETPSDLSMRQGVYSGPAIQT
ncbi:plant cysteine oxidase 3-like isoform X1 [Neltuma alba]|uniref:plant cysteine oxidase 3-like isoform X1 n=2 Tax=Neltuma alba TaxID=207710 RepID=UPI0010A2FD35|nr:plant cysteine oxidase 3-like isoform X1 [Prosopis alba]